MATYDVFSRQGQQGNDGQAKIYLAIGVSMAIPNALSLGTDTEPDAE